ncbi:MAG: hypothetical protein HC923_03000 [Myxococcales bacterium]|nr:hypothetical protein [Myxococcales bacterium]
MRWGLVRAVPGLGWVLALMRVRRKIQRKGWSRGGLDAGLDLVPIVGRGKNLIEIFTGDLIPERDRTLPPRTR